MHHSAEFSFVLPRDEPFNLIAGTWRTMEQDAFRWGNVISVENVWIHHRKDDHLFKAVNMGL